MSGLAGSFRGSLGGYDADLPESFITTIVLDDDYDRLRPPSTRVLRQKQVEPPPSLEVEVAKVITISLYRD